MGGTTEGVHLAHVLGRRRPDSGMVAVKRKPWGAREGVELDLLESGLHRQLHADFLHCRSSGAHERGASEATLPDSRLEGLDRFLVVGSSQVCFVQPLDAPRVIGIRERRRELNGASSAGGKRGGAYTPGLGCDR